MYVHKKKERKIGLVQCCVPSYLRLTSEEINLVAQIPMGSP